MKEWDLESYSRKFAETVTVFKDRLGSLISGYVSSVDAVDGNVAFYIAGKYEPELDPLYYRFENRIYETKSGYVALTRRFNRQWRIGLCRQNHDFTVLKGSPPQLAGFDPLAPLKIDVEKALQTEGPISDKIYITPNRVVYLKREIGFRKGSKFYVNENVCQEVSDSLRGFQCSINK